MDVVIHRFDIYIVTLDPTVGTEMQKRRPCVVISPDVMIENLSTVIIAPLTSTKRGFPTRIDCVFQGKAGQIALDQLHAVDQVRLERRIGRLDGRTASKVLVAAREMFAT